VRVAGLVVGSTAMLGCATELRMAEVRDPAQPNATIRYSAVRQETRRFPDYSVIDRAILAEAPAGEPSGAGASDQP
jgi:hypothetical protein